MTTRDTLKIGLLLSFWALVFYPIYPELIHDWLGHSDNSHGFLVPLVAGYFIWQRMGQVRPATPSSTVWGGIVLFLGLAGYVLGQAGNVAFLSRIAMVVTLLGLIWL